MAHDLIIRGGIVVDGTGLGRRRADVAVSRGRITAVGHVPNASAAERVIDAEGRGFSDRGALLPGYAADIMIFDPATIGPNTKRVVHDLPRGEARFSARPRGIHATIVNGEAIVLDGKLTRALPGQWVRPAGTHSGRGDTS